MKLLALLAAAMLLGGCSALPGEERSFAVALGVGEAGGVWQCCARIPTYQTGGGYVTLQGTGRTLGEAMALLNASAPMELHYGQLRLLLFSKELAQSGQFSGVLQALSARGEVRQQATLCVTQDGLTDVMDALEPVSGSRLSKSIEAVIKARDRLGVLPGTTLGEWQRQGERQQCALAAVALEPAQGNARPGMDASVGEMAAGGAGKLQFSGGWLLGQNGRVQGQLSPEEMQLITLMQGDLKQGVLALPEGTVTLLGAECEITLQEDGVHCRIGVTGSASPWTEEGLEEALLSSLRSLTQKLAAANCDVLGIGRMAIRQAGSMLRWHEMHWPERYPALPWHFTVEAGREA